MHPVTSELDLTIRQYERDFELQAIRRDGFAREAARISGRVGLVSRTAQAVRRILDPRGYAYRQATRNTATGDTGSTAPAMAAPVTGFPADAERAEPVWRDAA